MAFLSKFNSLKQLNYPEYSTRIRLINSPSESSNEGILDLSLNQKDDISNSMVLKASKSLTLIGKYTYSQNKTLLKKLSLENDIPTENIILTSGCDGALRVLSRLLINDETQVCIPVPSFGRYVFHAKMNQGSVKYFISDSFPFDFNISSLADFTIRNKTEVLILANPNNPTGIFKGIDEIEKLLCNYQGYLILDEALISSNLESCTSLIKRFKKLIITKSFSKYYGLAGARIGYVIADSKIIHLLNKIVSPFELSSLSIALANAAIEERVLEKNTIETETALDELMSSWHIDSDLCVTPSKSLNAVITWKSRSKNLYQILLHNNIKTVSCDDFFCLEGKNSVRICVKNANSMKRLVKVLSELNLNKRINSI